MEESFLQRVVEGLWRSSLTQSDRRISSQTWSRSAADGYIHILVIYLHRRRIKTEEKAKVVAAV